MDDFQESALAKLSFAALCVDMLVCFFLWLSLTEVFFHGSIGPLAMSLLPAVVLAHALIVEIFLFGRSIGRLCCGISLSDPDPRRTLSLGVRITRFAGALLSFIRAPVHFRHLPPHNRSERIVFKSDIAGRSSTRAQPFGSMAASVAAKPVAPPAPSPARRLVVTAGPHKGNSFSIQSPQMNIGRTAGWANIVLERDGKVSARHCRLLMRNGYLSIADGPSRGTPSSNGTYLNGMRIGNETFQTVPPSSQIQIGDTTISLSP